MWKSVFECHREKCEKSNLSPGKSEKSGKVKLDFSSDPWFRVHDNYMGNFWVQFSRFLIFLNFQVIIKCHDMSRNLGRNNPDHGTCSF